MILMILLVFTLVPLVFFVSVALLVVCFMIGRYIQWYFSPLHKLPGPSSNNDFWRGNFHDIAYLPYMEAEKKWLEEVGSKEEGIKVLHTTGVWGKSSIVVLDKNLGGKILANYPIGRDGNPSSFPKKKPLYKIIVGDGLVAVEEEDWRRHRRILEPFFNRSFLKDALGPAVRTRVTRMIEYWKTAAITQREIDVTSHVSALALDIIGSVALDHNFRGIDMIESWAKDTSLCGQLPEIQDKLLKSLMSILDVDSRGLAAQSMQPPHFFSKFILGMSPRLKNGRVTLDKAVDDIIANAVNDKNKNGYGSSPKSLLHLMLKTQESSSKGKTLSMYDIHSESKTLIMAGHETSATWLHWSIFSLCNHPEIQELVYQDVMKHVSSDTSTICIDETERMEYLGAFLQEVLRLYPPTGQVLRVAQGHEVIEGIRVPAGTRINIQNFLMHRNPEYWSEPEAFKPERWINPSDEEKERRRSAFLPFGAGPRYCIGQQFATFEVRLAFAYLVRAFRFCGAPSQRDTKFCFESYITLKAKPNFKVVVDKR